MHGLNFKGSQVIVGKLVFKNHELNKKVNIVLTNQLFGNCLICLNSFAPLLHYQHCGHLSLCRECSQKTSLPINSKCVFCRKKNLLNN